MLDPRHDCDWVRRRRCDLLLTGERLSAAGVSLRVWLSAVGHGKTPWYSARYGEDDADVIAVRLKGEASLERPPGDRDELGPLMDSVRDLQHVVERPLTAELCSDVGISLERQDELKPGARIAQILAAHDDCFVSFAPADESYSAAVIDSVLELHAFYLGMEVDWSEIRTEVLGILKRGLRMRFESDPERARLVISSGEPSLWHSIMRQTDCVVVDVRNGVAAMGHRFAHDKSDGTDAVA